MKQAKLDPRKWSIDDIKAQGPRINTVDAIQAFMGVGPATAKRVAREEADKLPFPVFQLGRKRVTPTAALLRALGVENDEPAAA
ncbi:hypothetical protein [Amycolatopsis sp. GM8]|uniref:hypothetical protein n=1 Tax=Amycolatopsis sp. GM8 TaxID=2896530 RepID=UPI001F2A3D40|nr:hypothetical protein [Amycolatopsis sp. GM8]